MAMGMMKIPDGIRPRPLANTLLKLYIVEGSITVAVGLVVMLVLPDLPENWKSLSPEMKSVAMRRIALDGTEADAADSEPMSQLQGMKLAFTDPKTYILAGMYHGTFSRFSKSMIRYF
jgi:hypothetical protein